MEALTEYVAGVDDQVSTFPNEVRPSDRKLIEAFLGQVKPYALKSSLMKEGFQEFHAATVIVVERAKQYYRWNEDSKREQREQRERRTGQAKGSDDRKPENSRLYDTPKEDRKFTCYNCGEDRHKSFECKAPKSDKQVKSIQSVVQTEQVTVCDQEYSTEDSKSTTQRCLDQWTDTWLQHHNIAGHRFRDQHHTSRSAQIVGQWGLRPTGRASEEVYSNLPSSVDSC